MGAGQVDRDADGHVVGRAAQDAASRGGADDGQLSLHFEWVSPSSSSFASRNLKGSARVDCQSALNLTFPPPAAPYFPRTDPALLRPNETSEPFSLVEGLDRQRLVHHDVWNLRRDEVEMDLAYLKGLDRDPPVVTPPEPPRQVAVEPPAPVPWQQESPPPGPFQWAAAPQAPQPLVRPPHQPPLQFQEPMPAIPQPPLLYQPAQPPIGPDPRSMQPTYGHQVLLESNLGRPGPGPGPPTVQPGHDDARLRAQLESYGWSSEVPDGRAGVRSGRSR